MRGTVVSVVERREGSELAAAASISDELLSLIDADEMDWTGGELEIGDEVIAYSMDEATDEVVLATPLASAYEEGEPVLISPAIRERIAYLTVPGQEEEIEARIPHHFWDRLPLGIRDELEAAEGETVEAAFEDEQLVLTDVIAQRPAADVGYLAGVEINLGTADVDTDSTQTVRSDPIPHGLSAAPTTIIATADYGAGKGTAKVNVTVGEIDGDTFRVKIRTVDATVLDDPPGGAFVRVHWLAAFADTLVGRPDREPSGATAVAGADAAD